MILNVSDAGTQNARMGASWFGIKDNTNATKDAINNYNSLLDLLADYKNQIGTLTKGTKEFNDAETALKDTKNKLSAATKTSNDNLNLYLQGLNGAKGSVKDYNVGLISATAKTIGLSIATTALNAIISWGLSVAINALVALLSYMINPLDHHVEKLNELKEEYDDITSRLDEVNNELETTAQRIDELNEKDNLAFVEEQELKRLKEENDELERQLYLLETRQREKGKEVQQQFVKTMKADIDNSVEYNKAGTHPYGNTTYSEREYADEQFRVLPRLKKEYDEAIANGNRNAKYLKNEIDRLEKYLGDRYDAFDEALDTLPEEYSTRFENPTEDWQIDFNKYLDDIYDFKHRYAIAMGDPQAVDKVFDYVTAKYEENLSKIKKDLADGTADNTISKEYIKYLLKLGVITDDAEEDILSVAKGIEEYINPVEESTDVTNELASSVKSLSEAMESLDTISEAIDHLNTAFKEFDDSGKVSFSTLNNIAEKFAGVDGIDTYIQKLSSASLTSSELSTILSELTIAKIKGQYTTEQLASANSELLASMLEESGVANATAIATSMVTTAKKELTIANAVRAASSEDDVVAYMTEANASEYTAKALEIFRVKKDMLNDSSYNSSASVSALLTEAKAAGVAAESYAAMAEVYSLMANYERLMNIQKNGGTWSWADIKWMENYDAELADAIKKSQQAANGIELDFDPVDFQFNFTGFDSIADATKDAYQEEREILDYNHEMGFISTKEYYNKLDALNDKYYKNSAEHQSEYLDNIVELHNMWNTMYDEDKDQLDYQHEMGVLSDEQYYAKLLSLSSAYYKGKEAYEKEWQDVQVELRQLQQQILDDTLSDYDDFLSRHEDLMISSAKAEKDITKKKLLAIEDAYRKGTLSQKEYLEKWNETMSEDFENTKSNFETAFDYMSKYIDEKLEALDEQNDKLEEQKELEEALAELEKAKMQRNKRMYVDGVGFVWVADQEAIKSAQKSYNELLDNKRLEEQKQYWEDLKTSLEEILTFQEGNEDRDITESLFGKNWQTNLEQGVNFISTIATKYASAIGGIQADILIKNGNQDSIVSQMKLNSSSWQGAGASERAYLAAQNEALGKALGWVKKNGAWYDKSGKRMYASGGVADFTGMAMLHGSKNSSEVIFNASDAAKLYEYIHTTPDLIQSLYARIFDNTDASRAVTGGQNIIVDMGGIHVHGNADRDTITEMSNVFDRKMNDFVSSLRNQSIQRAYKR